MYYLDFLSVYGYDLFIGKCRESAYGIARSHIGKVCKIFATKVYSQCRTVFFNAVFLFKEEQRLGKSSADVLLCKVYCCLLYTSDAADD